MKKLFALLLALAMVFGMAACGSSTAPKAEAPKAEAPKTEAPEAEAPVENETPAVDLSGLDVTCVVPYAACGGTDAVMRGLDAEAAKLAKALLPTESELEIVEKRLIPALDAVGEKYEKGIMFLPQLLSAAQAAQAVFEVLRASVLEKGSAPIKKGKLALATVKGDIHDIGKNIVKTILENYGYEVYDLGKDVAPEKICAAVENSGLKLVGLSALMTTTLPSMEESIRKLKALAEPPVIVVGGAVVTEDYAKKIGADHYAKDAREAVEIARRVFG